MSPVVLQPQIPVPSLRPFLMSSACSPPAPFSGHLHSVGTGWAKVGLQLWVHETQGLFLCYYLLMVVLLICTTAVELLLLAPLYSVYGNMGGAGVAGFLFFSLFHSLFLSPKMAYYSTTFFSSLSYKICEHGSQPLGYSVLSLVPWGRPAESACRWL